METLLEVRDLSKVFAVGGKKTFTAVDHVSFQLHEGETLGIVGESGCGKSTLARVIMGLTEASGGSVVLNGRELTGSRGRRLRMAYRDIQMVFQNPAGSFDPRRTLGDGIGESLRNAGIPGKERRRRVRELLLECDLTEDFADRYPHEVSGGQCQRAAIARALAIEPRILICDEATSALDVTVQSQVMKLLERLRRQRNLSYIFICHNLALVQSFCDHLLVMYDGKFVEEGTPDEVILNPKSEYARLLVDSVL